MSYIWLSLILAVFIGFGNGAHLSFMIGFNIPLTRAFFPIIQTHGHLQLIGWAGLFIISVSLYFIPRLTGVSFQNTRRMKFMFYMISMGLLIRACGHLSLPYMRGMTYEIWNVLIAATGVMELTGILIYAHLLWRLIKHPAPSKDVHAIRIVKPFMAMMLAGFVIYLAMNAGLLAEMSWRKKMILDKYWNNIAINLFVNLTLIPVAFAFSVRLLPLYLHIPVPGPPLGRLGWFYLATVCLSEFPNILTGIFSIAPPGALQGAGQAGAVLKAGTLLGLVWRIRIFTRSKPREKTQHPRSIAMSKNTGHFERLIYAAYIWLILGALFEIYDAGVMIVGTARPFGQDVSRHLYLMGFITHLILGVSVRMLPGFMGKKKIFSPALVKATLCLGVLSVLTRILPLVVPSALIESRPEIIPVLGAGFGISGSLGMLTILCLSINIVFTYRMKS